MYLCNKQKQQYDVAHADLAYGVNLFFHGVANLIADSFTCFGYWQVLW